MISRTLFKHSFTIGYFHMINGNPEVKEIDTREIYLPKPYSEEQLLKQMKKEYQYQNMCVYNLVVQENVYACSIEEFLTLAKVYDRPESQRKNNGGNE